jgi:hypothetical protein
VTGEPLRRTVPIPAGGPGHYTDGALEIRIPVEAGGTGAQSVPIARTAE